MEQTEKPAFSVRKWRIIKEISKDKMAELLGVHVNTYAAWEKNPENISVKYATAICAIFGVKFDEVIFLPEGLQNVE